MFPRHDVGFGAPPPQVACAAMVERWAGMLVSNGSGVYNQPFVSFCGPSGAALIRIRQDHDVEVAYVLARQESITKWGLRCALSRFLLGPHTWIPPTKHVPEVTV
jgi:hypothetical protein